ncbi:MAG: hypothetical protein ACHP6H_02005 [Legionellales bacterium]
MNEKKMERIGTPGVLAKEDLAVMLEGVDAKLAKMTVQQEAQRRFARKRKTFLNRLLGETNELGMFAVDLLDVKAASKYPDSALVSVSVVDGFYFGALALATIDLVRIPLIYLFEYVETGKAPFTLDKNSRFLYSGILFSLFLTAYLVPPVAGILGLVTAGLTMGVSTYLLGKAMYDRYQLKKEWKEKKKELSEAIGAMKSLATQARELESQLDTLTRDTNVKDLYEQIGTLKQNFDALNSRIWTLKEEETALKTEIDSKSISRLLNVSVGSILCASGLVGTVLLMFFPPVGLAILAGTTAAGAAFIVGRLVVAGVTGLYEKFGDKGDEAEVIGNSEKLMMRDLTIMPKEAYQSQATYDVPKVAPTKGTPSIPPSSSEASSDSPPDTYHI